MRKGVTLLEMLIVLVLAGLIMPFLFRMISVTFEVVNLELSTRQELKEDLSFVLENEKKYLKSISEKPSEIKFFFKKGNVVNQLAIMGNKI